jgi:hypothetical protein
LKLYEEIHEEASCSSSSSSSSSSATTNFYENDSSTTLKASSSFLSSSLSSSSAAVAVAAAASNKSSTTSKATSLTAKQEARIYKDMGGEDQIHNHIFDNIFTKTCAGLFGNIQLVHQNFLDQTDIHCPCSFEAISTNNLTGKQIYPGALVYQRTTFQFRYSKKGFTV